MGVGNGLYIAELGFARAQGVSEYLLVNFCLLILNEILSYLDYSILLVLLTAATLYDDRRRTSVVSAGWRGEKNDVQLHPASLLFLHCIILSFCLPSLD